MGILLSGSYRKGDGYVTRTPNVKKDVAETLAECMFEEQTDYDELEIQEEIKLTKTLKRVALAQIITYPIQWVVVRLCAGHEGTKELTTQFRMYLDFYRGKMTLTELKEKLL